MSVLATLAILALLPAVQSFGFPYGSEKVRGVNLGGWLVLEPWITPSIFDNTGDSRIVDEWTFGQYQNRATATSVLQNHWNSWITEGDFAAIAAAGLNHVRLPIGYWAFDVSGGEPFIQGQLPYLQNAVGWAQNHGLRVVVDLHGVPGSQNGFDNSGQRLPAPTWQNKQSNIDRSKAIINTLISMFENNPNVVPIIAPLNEPAGFYSQQLLDVTKQYWKDTYSIIRHPGGSSQASNTVILIHDAFQPLDSWNGFMPPSNYQGVIIDTHIYEMFSMGGNQMSYTQHIQSACSHTGDFDNSQLWVIVGEWTPAATDCAKYLNGFGVGARYDGSYPGSSRVGSCQGVTGSASTFSDSYKVFLRQHWEAQVMTFEKGQSQGWMQWTWKAEQADDWSYQAGLANGWIPSNPTDFKYPNICG